MTTHSRQIAVSSRWLPDGESRPESYVFSPSRAERKACRKRQHIAPSVWAPRHRILSEESALPGPWQNDTAPFVTPILDAAYTSGIEEVDWCAAPQVGKTEGVNTILGYAIDRDPGPAMLVYPDRDTAKHNLSKRIFEGLIRPSARLRSYLTGAEDDISSTRILLEHMAIYTAWAKSPSSLSNKAIKLLIFDEVDKYPRTSSRKETGPIPLGEKRTRTYKWSRKIFKISSPTIVTGEIWQALQACQVVFHFFVRCPHCGQFQRMHWDQFRMPENVRDPERIETEGLGWYECEFCKGRWEDHHRDKAVSMGEYRDILTGKELFAYLREHRPKRIGFHTPAWLSRFVPLAEVVAAFLRGSKKHGGTDWKERAKDFRNAYEAEPWENFEVQREADRIWELCDNRPRMLVPGPVNGIPRVAGLVAGVDTQDRSLPYSIVAFGWGQAEESWRIRVGTALTIPVLEEILWGQAYRDAEGNEYRVRCVFWDAMGHRTKEVYAMAVKHRGKMLPIRGRDTLSTPITFSPIEYYPGTKIRIPGGVTLANLDTKFFKDDLSTALQVQPGDPGGFHLYDRTAMPADYADQMCNEYFDDETNKWIQPEHKRVDFWDCEVYARACWYYLGGANWDQPKARVQPKPRPVAERTVTQADILNGFRPSWFGQL
ncbi:terminase gpA endonuclease subunit [Pseudodesulfovibrio tunisiensis]|uniref:terminase gpA endonuclease subunit n=1 Tax=Pseudodesulfovibrio tunisiensis TaxID=463192 RepID=UPI001FB52465|nr:terminase gpA endonuclease subunit [Pseudodesulfovibrio tunisiensis]